MLDLKSFAPEVLYTFPNRNVHPGLRGYHQHEFIELSVMLEGFADYRIGDTWHRIQSGQVLVFNPGVWHQERQPQYSMSMQLHIGLRGVALPGMAQEHLPFADSVVDLGAHKASFLACARRIADEAGQIDAFGHQMLVQAEVCELLCLLLRALPDNAVAADPQVPGSAQDASAARLALVSSAVFYLESHYEDAITLPALAEYLNVSAAHLSRTFKAVRGETITSFLTRLRMEKAHQILHETDLPVKRVATAVGYQDPFYFSKLFKRYFGAAPSVKQ